MTNDTAGAFSVLPTPPRSERLDLSQLVRRSANDRTPALDAAGVTLSVAVPNVPVWVVGDGAYLEQVMAVLLDNAAKFTPPEGRVTVELTVDENDDHAVVTVRDTGVGIEPELLGDLFRPADRPPERPAPGGNRGLALARILIELHAGTIAAVSDGRGTGAVFTVRLPRLPEVPALGDVPAASGFPDNHARILVIEDNRDSADSLKLLLETCGGEVTVAYTGWQGLAAARAVQPRVVLCDIGLPGMDGFALAAALRQHPSTARARLIALTGFGRAEDRERALRAGFDDYLVKPVAPASLIAYVFAHSA